MEDEAAPAGEASATTPLRSVHTSSFPALLERLGVALLVTTYQAGKLVVVRAHDGQLNTHFRTMPCPMGIAAAEDRLAIGTRRQIWEFYHVPSAISRLSDPGRHDACFLPRSCHFTGNVAVHEMAWLGDALWFVNTRFSCLSTLDRSHSFVARWRPPFVTALAPEDRCHLNGLGLSEGRPRYVTALGETDERDGWRAGKARGGVLVDVDSGETIARGLSMPHSPRWHAGRLWVLESGTGSLGVVDPASGRFEAVAALPGFTRGLDFHGPFAFVGLSQARETAIFSGIPITEPARERHCGVWVVDTRVGRVVAFLRFEDAVREIFAVQVLAHRRYPDVIFEDRAVLDHTFTVAEAGMGPRAS